MSTLRDQLLQKGLVSKDAVERVEKKLASAGNGHSGLRTIAEFVEDAREALLKDPGQIHAVVESAHRFKGSSNRVDSRVYKICLQVRDRLPKLNRADQEVLIRRAFRRKNPTATLPGEREEQ